RLVLPLLQNRHSPHSAVYSGITWSPGLTLVTPSPTSTTMPAPSWPSTAGNSPSGSSPERVNASVWQTPVWVMRISTSPLRGGSTSISTICKGCPAAKATAARDFRGFSVVVVVAGGSLLPRDFPILAGMEEICVEAEYALCAEAGEVGGVVEGVHVQRGAAAQFGDEAFGIGARGIERHREQGRGADEVQQGI